MARDRFQPGHGPLPDARAPDSGNGSGNGSGPRPSDSSQRLERLGSDALSTSELLALLIGNAGRRPPARVALDLLETHGSLRALARVSTREFVAGHGLGRATAQRVVAALALGRRAGEECVRVGQRLKSSNEIFEAFHLRLRDLKKERFITVMVDGKNQVLGEVQVSEGILTASLVHPREVFAPAIRGAAAGLILVHNHPSGDPEPSPEDHEVTRRLTAVGELVGIRILDHVIIGDGRYVSFLERGLLT